MKASITTAGAPLERGAPLHRVTLTLAFVALQCIGSSMMLAQNPPPAPAAPDKPKTAQAEKTPHITANKTTTATVEATKTTAVPVRADQPISGGLLDQLQNELTQLATRTSPMVVWIEGQTPGINLYFPNNPRVFEDHRQTPNEKRDNKKQTSDREHRETEVTIRFGRLSDAGPPKPPGAFNYEMPPRKVTLAPGAQMVGSGFIVPNGYVVTTADVARDQKTLVVVLANGKRIRADWTVVDLQSNLALLRVRSLEHEEGLTWGDSSRLLPGSLALTIGNQSGYPNSVALGVISGVHRAGRSGPVTYNNLIQFQGAVGLGSSGGPLLNSHGEVVGVIVATPFMHSVPAGANAFSGAPHGPPMPDGGMFIGFGGISNTGFAVPASIAQPIIANLISARQASWRQRGWFGMKFSEGKPAGRPGVEIEMVIEGSPATLAGLQPGDLVLRANDVVVNERFDIFRQVPILQVGSELHLFVQRGEKTFNVSLKAAIRPSREELIKRKQRHITPTEPAH